MEAWNIGWDILLAFGIVLIIGLGFMIIKCCRKCCHRNSAEDIENVSQMEMKSHDYEEIVMTRSLESGLDQADREQESWIMPGSAPLQRKFDADLRPTPPPRPGIKRLKASPYAISDIQPTRISRKRIYENDDWIRQVRRDGRPIMGLVALKTRQCRVPEDPGGPPHNQFSLSFERKVLS